MATMAPNANATRTARTPEPATIATTEKATAAVTVVQAVGHLAEAEADPVPATHPLARPKDPSRPLQGIPL